MTVPLLELLVAALAALLGQPLDRVLLHDGRMIEGKVVDEDREGFTVVELAAAEIPIDNDLIRLTLIDDIEDYVPKNEKERRNLERGLVLFEGQWMSRTRRETELERRREREAEEMAALRERQDWRNAVIESTRHFIIKSNCTDEVIEQYADRLEQYYDAFTDEWNIRLNPGDKDGKTKVFLYRTPEDFWSITRRPRGVGGFFNFYDDELHLPHDDRNPEKTLDVLYHEGNHLLTHLIAVGVIYPNWMNEGMAEYYGTAERDEDGDFVVGELQYSRIVSMRRDEAMDDVPSLREVLMTERGDFGAREYAYAWSFVHFLMSHDDYARPFKLFFANLEDNRDIVWRTAFFGEGQGKYVTPDLASVVASLEDRLGESIEDLEAEWRDYREQTYGELDAPAYYRAAGLAESLARRAELDGEWEDYDRYMEEAREHYEKATSMGITDGRCWRDYAELLRTEFFDGETGLAMAERAIELDPINAYNYMEAAGCLLMDGPQQDLDRSLAMADTAKALAPRSAGVAGLYRELMGELEPALEVRDRFLEDDPRDWMIFPDYPEGEPEPDRITGLSTDDVRALIRAGEVSPRDWIFQAWYEETDAAGEPIRGEEPWDQDWVRLEDCTVFADDLAAAATEDETR